MTKFYNNSKNPILGPLWAFLPKFGQKSIYLGKRALSVFKYSNYLPSSKKNKKTNYPFLRKILNLRKTGWTDRQKKTMIL